MRRSSLRTWLLFLSVIFALVLVGAVAVTTYFIVSEGMSRVAYDTAGRLARLASQEVNHRITEAQLDAAAQGLEGAARDAEAERQFLRAIPQLFRGGGVLDGEFAWYDADGEPFWFSDRSALVPSAEERQQALLSHHPTESRESRSPLTGFAAPARLGEFTVHVPVVLPTGAQAVLDVVYSPAKEEGVIDRIRAPMAALAFVAMIATVLMMQVAMGWVLALVNELRRAADSIDAGDLDIHLPEMGEHEVGYLARSINRLMDRLRRRSQAQTRFVADASHELATPVAGIRGYVGILRDWGGEDPDVRAEAVRAIDRESRRMARLINDLLTLIRSGREADFRAVRFDLNARVREVLAVTATRYRESGLEFVGPEEGQLAMTGDPDRIEDVLSILVDNAAKYTPAGGRVEVRTRRRRDVIIVEVSDTGVGIPAEDIPSVFDRFYRSDASRSKETGGFGLGLAIAKRIVETHGGTIDVQSVLGAGTMFTVRLPRSRV